MPEVEIQNMITNWSDQNLDQCGRYVGEELKHFPCTVGEWVPVDSRYSAILNHAYATQIKEMACQQQ